MLSKEALLALLGCSGTEQAQQTIDDMERAKLQVRLLLVFLSDGLQCALNNTLSLQDKLLAMEGASMSV
jgi:hypothetical protein